MWLVKKRTLKTDIKEENDKKKAKKSNIVKRLSQRSNHRPINRKSSHFQLRHEGFDELWLSKSLFFRLWFFLEFVLALGALGAHPAPGITCKNIKTRLVCGIFLFYTSRSANIHNGTNLSSTRRSSPAALSQGVPKRTKRAHLWRALTRVYDVPFWYLPTFGRVPPGGIMPR